MQYEWLLRNLGVRSHDNIMLGNRKGKYTQSYALAEELAIWTSVFYLTEFSRVAAAHSFVLPRAALKLYFVRFIGECAPEGCNKKLIIV